MESADLSQCWFWMLPEGVSTDTSKIDIYMYKRKLIMAHGIMKAKKAHYLLSISWRPRKVSNTF